MVSVEFVDNLKNLNIFAFRICVNFRRTQRPLFCSDYLDFLYADYFYDNYHPYRVLRSINQSYRRSGTSKLQKITKLSIFGHFDNFKEIWA